MLPKDDDIIFRLKDAWHDVPYDTAMPLRILAACRPRAAARSLALDMQEWFSWRMMGALAASLMIGLYTGALTDLNTVMPTHTEMVQNYVLAQGGTW